MSFWEKSKAWLGTVPFTWFSQNSCSNLFCCLLIKEGNLCSLEPEILVSINHPWGLGDQGLVANGPRFMIPIWGFELWTTPHDCYEQSFHFTQKNSNMEPEKKRAWEDPFYRWVWPVASIVPVVFFGGSNGFLSPGGSRKTAPPAAQQTCCFLLHVAPSAGPLLMHPSISWIQCFFGIGNPYFSIKYEIHKDPSYPSNTFFLVQLKQQTSVVQLYHPKQGFTNEGPTWSPSPLGASTGCNAHTISDISDCPSPIILKYSASAGLCLVKSPKPAFSTVFWFSHGGRLHPADGTCMIYATINPYQPMTVQHLVWSRLFLRWSHCCG